MATLQRFQNHSSLRVLTRLALGLALALGGAAGCKKSTPAADAGKKPPIVKAKKAAPGDAKDKENLAAKGDDGATDKVPAGPGVVSQRAPRAVGAAEGATPAAAPAAAPTVAAAPVPAAVPAPAAAAAPAAAPAPVVPVPAGRGRPVAEIVAKADPAKPEVAKPEPPKAEEPPLPPGAVVVHAVPTEGPLDVNGYIIAADLPKVLGSKMKFERKELAGISPTPNYNAMFYAADKADLFGVSVQVWRDPNLAESRTRFNTMKNSYSNVTPTNKVTDMGFRSYYGNVVTLVFVDPRRPLLAAISCSSKVCTGDQMIELARRVAERLH